MQQLQRWGFTQTDSITTVETVASLRVRRAPRIVDPSGLRQQTCSAGFTLIELMVTIAVAAILATIAVPAYTSFISGNRARAEMDAFVDSLVYARSAASKRGQSVTVCASTDGSSCSGAGPWGTGWLVFLDVNGNRTVDASTDEILRLHDAIAAGDTLTGNGNIEYRITLNRYGRPVSIGTVTLTTTTGNKRCVKLSIAGHLNVVSGEDCS